MKSFLSLFFLFVLSGSRLFGQDITSEQKSYKFDNNFDLALSSSGNQNSAALSWAHFHALTKKERLKIGYGLRFTSQFGKDLYYTTAPADLTSKPENIDSIFISSPQNNALNLSLNFQYTFKKKLDLGFNIDAFGITFGYKVEAKYYSHSDKVNSINQSSSPTKLNYLLTGDNDHGMLNSEFYARYWFNDKLAVKAGATFLFTEYTTDQKLRLENDRWRNKSFMGMIGLTFSPYR